jgi:predicted ATPase
VLDAVRALADEILPEAPGVSVLATSRSALKLKEERIFRLGPLGVPEADVPVDEARSYGAVALLEARAQALDPRFTLDEENVALAIGICRNLDGIALAIELAAARLPVLGLKGLAERIGERFRLLTAGTRNAPTRQQTLLAALDWSYELLSPAEQKVFRRLGVFAGGFSLAIATAVSRGESTDEWAAIDALAALVDRSLVEVEAGAAPRYRLLESTRAYALLKLRENAGEQADAQRAHAAGMLAHFQNAEEQAWSLEEAEWLATYAPELDNLRAALDWSVQHDRVLGATLLGQSRFLFLMSGLDYELRERCERLEPTPETPLAPADAAAYWRARGEVTRYVQRSGSYRLLSKAAALYEALHDDRGRYVALSDAVLCSPAGERRGLVEAMRRLERAEWPARVRYWGLRAYAYADLFEGRVAEVGPYLERSLELARACRSPSMIDRSLSNLADHALATGDLARAIQIGRELLRNIRSKYNVLVAQGNLANALLQAGEIAEARAAIAKLNEHARAAQWDTFATFAPVFALLAACEGRMASAARLLGYAAARDRKMGGDTEPNERRARDLATERVAPALAADELAKLMAEGERLSEDQVCALTLEA